MDKLIIFLAKYLIVVVVLVFIYVWLKLDKRARVQLVVALIVAGVLALILDKLAGKLYYHPRPFAVKHIKPLVAHAADNGFPSEHTILAMALTSLIYFYRRNLAALALVLTLLVGAGRVWAHVHWPIDIAGGIVIGLIAGCGGYWSARKIYALAKPSAD